MEQLDDLDHNITHKIRPCCLTYCHQYLFDRYCLKVLNYRFHPLKMKLGKTNGARRKCLDPRGQLCVFFFLVVFTVDAYKRLQDFTIRVSDSDDITSHTDVCAREPSFLPNGGTGSYSCDPPRIGRYLSIVNGNKTESSGRFARCEVVVIGAEAISKLSIFMSVYFSYFLLRTVAGYCSLLIALVLSDCSLCGSGACDPLNGCENCPDGKRKPNCKKG